MTNRSCPICNFQNSGKAFIPFPYSVAKVVPKEFPAKIVFCDNCSAGFADPELPPLTLTNYYANEKSPWGEIENIRGPRDFPVHFSLALARWKLIVKYLRSKEFGQDPNGITIADIGAGNGALGFAIAHSHAKGLKIHKYFAQDLDQKVMNRLRRIWPEKTEVKLQTSGSLAEIPADVDVVVFSHVLEHVQNPRKFMEEALSKLKIGGLVFVEVPNQDFRFKADVFPHVLFFNQKSLTELLAKMGISQISCKAWGGSPQAGAGWKARVERMILKASGFIPSRLLFGSLNWLYGGNRLNVQGPWLRFIGLKSEALSDAV